jgi:DNA-binding FadR family transcriptional regulator
MVRPSWTVRMTRVEIPPFEMRVSSVSAQIAAHLERLIASGELNAGDRLPAERELAADLQVSRASLREAMHELEAKNLIERKQGRGTRVLARPKHAHDLYDQLSGVERRLRDIAELRATTEPQIARLAATRATEANRLELDSVLKRHSADGLTPEVSVEIDQQFHLLLAHAAQNPLLVSLNELTSSWTTPIRVLSHATRRAREVSHRGHSEIFHAVLERDAEAAGAAMLRHLHDVADLNQQSCIHIL